MTSFVTQYKKVPDTPVFFSNYAMMNAAWVFENY